MKNCFLCTLNFWTWLTSATNRALSVQHTCGLPTAPTLFHVLSAHAHKWVSISRCYMALFKAHLHTLYMYWNVSAMSTQCVVKLSFFIDHWPFKSVTDMDLKREQKHSLKITSNRRLRLKEFKQLKKYLVVAIVCRFVWGFDIVIYCRWCLKTKKLKQQSTSRPSCDRWP